MALRVLSVVCKYSSLAIWYACIQVLFLFEMRTFRRLAGFVPGKHSQFSFRPEGEWGSSHAHPVCFGNRTALQDCVRYFTISLHSDKNESGYHHIHVQRPIHLALTVHKPLSRRRRLSSFIFCHPLSILTSTLPTSSVKEESLNRHHR